MRAWIEVEWEDATADGAGDMLGRALVEKVCDGLMAVLTDADELDDAAVFVTVGIPDERQVRVPGEL